MLHFTSTPKKSLIGTALKATTAKMATLLSESTEKPLKFQA